jgi:hypothetical protein
MIFRSSTLLSNFVVFLIPIRLSKVPDCGFRGMPESGLVLLEKTLTPSIHITGLAYCPSEIHVGGLCICYQATQSEMRRFGE